MRTGIKSELVAMSPIPPIPTRGSPEHFAAIARREFGFKLDGLQPSVADLFTLYRGGEEGLLFTAQVRQGSDYNAVAQRLLQTYHIEGYNATLKHFPTEGVSVISFNRQLEGAASQ